MTSKRFYEPAPREVPSPYRVLSLVAGLSLVLASAAGAQDRWPVHSMARPRPPVVAPGPAAEPSPPPADAIVLFDGKDLAAWQSGGDTPRWLVRDGYMMVLPGSGGIATRRAFGDIQLHIEWMAPDPPRGSGQDRGNSGVFLMDRYEVQILDSYGNDTYPDGQAGALYGQHPPLVNASRPPGQWQTYDIIFRRPRFREDGALARPARATVLHNGVLIHDAVPFLGRTVHGTEARYTPHADTGPIALQDHEHPVRFRNVWVRELKEAP